MPGGATFEERAVHYLSSIPEDAKGAFGATARLAAGRPVDLAGIKRDLYQANSRLDCADFKMAAFLRLLYLYRSDENLPPDLLQKVTEAVLNFKYWIDEPGRDSMCYWSENHQILFHSDEYLAGALFPEEVFTNTGMTGREHMEKGRRLMERWFSWRERFGFSEWLSNVYYDEDLYALLNLHDFAPDKDTRTRAAMAIDQIALNIALNSFHGQFRCTHGRTYEENVMTSSGDDVRQVIYLLWGTREFTPDLAEVSRSGITLATSTYRLPPAIGCIGSDASATLENYQSHGISMDEAPRLGIGYDDFESGMFFWGMGMYSHHEVIDLTARMWKEWDLYDNAFFMGLPRGAVWLSKRGRLKPWVEKLYIASEGAFLHGAHTYTYRTPDYMLSSVLDHRPGEIGAQNLTWAATLGPDAFVFTTYPGMIMIGGSPGRWTGNGSNPRIAQYRNVLVAIYNAPFAVALGEVKRYGYSHACFPGRAFDATMIKGGWIFGRKDDGYVALYSHARPDLGKTGKPEGYELAARGRTNVWICEMGRADDNGSFEDFVDEVSRADVKVDGTRVRYDSPGIGPVEFDWTGPFMVDGREIPMHRDMRYDNIYVRAPRFAERLEINCGGESLVLDFASHERIVRER